MRRRAGPVGEEHDGGAVSRGNVRRAECEPVLRRERDLARHPAELRGLHGSQGAVGRDDRDRDGQHDPDDEDDGENANREAPGDPPALAASTPPEEAESRGHEHQPCCPEQQAGDGVRPHASVRCVDRGDACADERPDAEDERRCRHHPRARQQHEHCRKPENREWDDRWDDVVIPASAGRGRREPVHDDVQGDGRQGKKRDAARQRRSRTHVLSLDQVLRHPTTWEPARRRRPPGARRRGGGRSSCSRGRDATAGAPARRGGPGRGPPR